MNIRLFFLISSVLLSLFTTPSFAADKHSKSKSNESVATETYSKGSPLDELQLLLDDQQAASVKISPELKNALQEQLTARKLFAQEARKANLEKSFEVVTRINMAQDEILARNYQKQYANQHPVPEAQLKSAYDAIKIRAGDTEYFVRQIFVLSEDEAKQVISRLAEGENFADLAKEFSKDEATRDKGGEIGWITPLSLQQQIVGAVISLKKGEYSHTPIKINNGWHVITVEDTRPFVLPEYQKLLPQLREELTRKVLAAHLAELRKNAASR